ncbi:type VII secretion protein EccC [Cryobacterium roopkundense]|uniref:S-DNA-T family DNA segregation ATPase FtsK/SpoIIIE n=1 Tax=Cryobacterium roopkundense TaxID=1001240 RepID=A0A7W8ZYT3_9MICO|nr:type VII secretion protein EccC [Cryobacterium roopkundense]MBB5642553.1 S-DNA-T family DNA segregation ATPase FtsK/SpoIIIE [Cryobacterium roopkundense]
MTLKLVHRPTRVTRPLRRPEPEIISPPPAMQDGAQGGVPIQALIPVLGAGTSVIMMVTLRGNALFMVIGALILIVAIVGGLAMALTQRGNAARTRRVQRERYLDYLERLRARMRQRGKDVRNLAGLLGPEPAALIELVRDPGRLWERRRHHTDFLCPRLGVGDRTWFDLAIPAEQNPVQPFDPILSGEAGQVVEHYSTVRGMPIDLRLNGAGKVAIIGDRADAVRAARALILQLAAFHAPDDVQMAIAYPSSAAEDWRGVDLLPHFVDESTFDGPVPARRVAPDTQSLRKVLGQELGDRAQLAATAKRSGSNGAAAENSRLIIFVDDYGHVASALPVPDADLTPTDLQITMIHLLSDRLHEPSDVTIRVTVGKGQADITDARDDAEGQVPVQHAVLDQISGALFETVARMLTPLRLNLTRQDEVESARAVDIAELLKIDDISTFDTASAWETRSPRDFLRVPIGLDDFGEPVLLDLKESAQLGMGPHGLCIGATGSGKSELLRTLILALSLSHGPEDVSMVLVDYKGGAAFAPFAGLPHVAGIIDNLADDPQLTQRARVSIAGEVVRRQQLLKDADNSPSITHYRELQATRPDLPALPHLLIVIDEFGELLAAEPDFVDLLLTIGRIGRSIGVHLLLSSQRIEAGKLRGLETYLSYRVGLRTFSASESSIVLDTPDAFHLPAIPGYAYLKVDTSVYRRFRSGYVSGPVSESDVGPADATGERLEARPLPLYNGLGRRDDTVTAEEALARPTTGRVLVDAAVDELRSSGTTVPPIWLSPLPERFALARIVSDETPAALQVAMGLLDEPEKQRQDPWLIDLTRSGGHLAVFGAPQTGRSTFLRTMAVSLSLTHTPRQVSIYAMDFTGSGLTRIAGFPHVGGVATRSNRDRLRRLLEELAAMLATRERLFAERGIDSLGTMRALHAAGQVPELVAADIVLLVDGLGALRSEFEELEPALYDLLQRGSSFGIHVVMSMTRWNELRMAQQPLVGTRIELRLNDPMDSQMGRKLAATLRVDQPGRALTDTGLFAHIALPVLDDTADELVGDELEALAARVAHSWEGPSAAPIRLLPESFSAEELPDAIDSPDAVPFGLRQDTMEPAYLDFASADQHLLVFGDQGSGKSTLLQGVIQGLTDRYTPDELVIAIMDVRGQLSSACPDEYLGGLAESSGQARTLATAIAEELGRRQASADRSVGPRIVVIADDLDILASGGTEPLNPLLPFLPSARELRLNVFVTRPVAGATRALYDVVLQSLRDTGATSLILSGERSEGQISPGVYAEQLPPGRGRLVRRGDRPRIVQIAQARVPEVVS